MGRSGMFLPVVKYFILNIFNSLISSAKLRSIQQQLTTIFIKYPGYKYAFYQSLRKLSHNPPE